MSTGGDFLFDIAVQEDIKVTEFKEKLAEKLRADGPESYRECVGEHLRVRECGAQSAFPPVLSHVLYVLVK